MNSQKLIDRFKKSGLLESEEFELDNLDYAKLVYDSFGNVVVENEHSSQFDVDQLSKAEMKLFYDSIKLKTIYRNVFLVEVLSEEPIEESMSLSDIASEGETGSFSIATKEKVANQKIKGAKAVAAIKAQGSDPSFFMVNESGFQVEY